MNETMEDLYRVSVGSHRAAIDRAKRRIIEAANECEFEAALMAATDAMRHKAAVEELEFQREAWEVNHG